LHYRMGPGGYGGGLLSGIPPTIRQLILINVIVFLVTALLGFEGRHTVNTTFGLVPANLLKGMVWQVGTYMFLHGGLMHLVFNMFALLMFGSDLERWWGSRNFLKYYLLCGVGGGVLQVLSAFLFGGVNASIIGASGAVFGVLIAYGMAFPERQVLLWFVIPVSARALVAIFVFLEVMFVLQQPSGGGIARFAHLGGALVGYLYLKQEFLIRKWKRLMGQSRSRGPRSDPRDEVSDEVIDTILDKISREGMGSLSAEEKRILHDSAERARKRQRGS